MTRLRRTVLAAAMAAGFAAAGPAMTADRAPSVAELNGQVKAMGFKGGRWRMSTRFVTAEAVPLKPGGAVPAELSEKLHQMVGRLTETENCYDPDSATGGDLILPQIHIESDCTAPRFDTADGRLDIEIACGSAASGAETRMRIRGVYLPESMNITTDVDVGIPAQGIRTLLTVSANAARMGPCLVPTAPPAPPGPPAHKPNG